MDLNPEFYFRSVMHCPTWKSNAICNGIFFPSNFNSYCRKRPTLRLPHHAGCLAWYVTFLWIFIMMSKIDRSIVVDLTSSSLDQKILHKGFIIPPCRATLGLSGHSWLVGPRLGLCRMFRSVSLPLSPESWGWAKKRHGRRGHLPLW